MKNNDESTVSSTANGCPVKNGKNCAFSTEVVDGIQQSTNSPSTSFWTTWISSSGPKKNSVASTVSTENLKSTPSIEEAAQYAQTPQLDQKLQLSVQRQVSSIPRIDITSNEIVDTTTGAVLSSSSSESSCPVKQRNGVDVPMHQHGDTNGKWVYPSEQQLYNAMRKKGWTNVPEDSIPTVLAIHNSVNEMTWSKIVDWEGTSNIFLSKFQGRPRDISPKAFFFTYIIPLNDEAPFDRHDWYIKHNNSNTEQRYIIDYYYRESKNNPNLPPTPYIDSRPALDSPRAVGMRIQQLLCDTYPGITTFIKQQKSVFEKPNKKEE
jgi:cytochrome c heme-lyase